MFRVHQFEKIEQFVICEPEKSWDMHEEMIKHSEDFFQSLGIPYRVVSIVGGALNNAAAKKYDLEGWFPGYGTYRELVSCSNCTDYQSRAMNTKYGTKKQGENSDKNLVHMLNSTLCATGRAMCVILENYQTPEGVKIPEVLQPYLKGKEFIPWDEEGLKYHLDEIEQEKAKEKKKTEKKQNERKTVEEDQQKDDLITTEAKTEVTVE
jgi:seryl-tRNA synthetase